MPAVRIVLGRAAATLLEALNLEGDGRHGMASETLSRLDFDLFVGYRVFDGYRVTD